MKYQSYDYEDIIHLIFPLFRNSVYQEHMSA